jgi:hypothetical protein
MTRLSEQIARVRDVLQQTSTDSTITSNIIAAHQESVQKLARVGAFSNILWVNGVTGQSQYTLPNPTVSIEQVIYNEVALRYATEASLDNIVRGWESLLGEPQYWTVDGQAPNVFRLVPSPVRTGSTTPTFPPVPLALPLADNLVIFLTEDPSSQLENDEDVLPTLLDWDDVLVYRTIRQLAERETHDQNLPVAELCRQLEQLWERSLGF